MFKGITFSGSFFEMIIHHHAAGGAAVLLASGVNQSQMWEPHADGRANASLLSASPKRARVAEELVPAGRGIVFLSSIWMYVCIYTKI